MSSERSEPVGSPVKVVKVCFAYVVKPFTGEVVKVCSGPKDMANRMCEVFRVFLRRMGLGHQLQKDQSDDIYKIRPPHPS